MKNKNFMSERMEELKIRLANCKKKTDKIEKDFEKLHTEANVPHPLMIDEVAASFVSFLRVQSWEDLGTEFGGYKVGRILAYILDVLCTEIEDSTAATIRVDIPLYEQCPIVKMKYNKEFDFGEWAEPICKCGGKCKHETKSETDEEKACLYCKEKDGTINPDVFVEIHDAELGPGWACKECFLESCKETQELLDEREEELEKATTSLQNIKKLICEPIGAKTESQMIKNQNERLSKIYKYALEGLGEEVPECL